MARRRPPVTRPASNGSLTWRYVGGAAVSLVILGGSGWLTYVQRQITTQTVAMDVQKEKLADQKTQQAVTGQRVEQIDKKVDEVRKDVGDIKNILQQIQINQQQQIRDAPKR